MTLKIITAIHYFAVAAVGAGVAAIFEYGLFVETIGVVLLGVLLAVLTKLGERQIALEREWEN